MLQQWKRRSVRTRFVWMTTAAVALLGTLWCWAGVRSDLATERMRASARLEAVAHSAAVAVDADGWAPLDVPPPSWDAMPPEIRRSQEKLAQLRERNDIDGSIAVVRLTERFRDRIDTNPNIVHDGVFEITVSSHDAPRWGERLSYLPDLHDVLVEGETAVVGPVETRDGDELLAFTPLTDSFGETVGFVRVAAPPHVAFWPLVLKIGARLVLTLASIWLAAVGTRRFVDSALAPINALTEKAEELARGELGKHIGAEGQAQEVRGLANALEDVRNGMIERRTRDARVAERLNASKRASEDTLARHSSLLVRMSHGLRPPLEAFSAALRRLDTLELEEEQRRLVKHSLNAGYDLSHGLEEILQVARIQGGDGSRVQAPFQLGPMLRQIVHVGRTEAERNGNVFRVVAPEDLPSALSGDPGALQYVLTELVDNATRATQDGSISLRVTPVEANEEAISIKFEVADTGAGLAEHEVAHVAQLVRAGLGGDGTPHGLSVAGALTRLCGGELAFDSRPGGGSRFWFCLTFQRASTTLRPVPLAA